MTDLIGKYFDNKQPENNTYFPSADLNKIKQLEKSLSIELPQDYVDFLCRTNGYEGILGESYVILASIESVEEYTESYGGEFFPWIVYIGTDGGNEMYVIDRRKEQLQFGILPFIGQESDFISLGDSFEEFVKHLYFNDFWKE